MNTRFRDTSPTKYSIHLPSNMRSVPTSWQMHRFDPDNVATSLNVIEEQSKRRSLMQRLSSWFEDHLPLRRRDNVRRSERGSRRKASKSAAPRMRYTVTNATAKHKSDFVNQMMPIAGSGPHSMSINMIDKESLYVDGYVDQRSYYHDDMVTNTFDQLETSIPVLESMSQSFSSTASRPSRIRTNPWVSNTSSQFRSPQPPATRSHYSAPDALSSAACGKGILTSAKKPNPELLYSSMDRSAQLRVKSLDESTCSSGYGSQDSSPESSVHSPDWQQKRNVEDKAVECNSVDLDATVMSVNDLKSAEAPKMRVPRADFFDDEHMYHEVETLHRLSLLLEEHACTSEVELMSPQPTTDRPDAPLDEISRCSSPIYAVPYDSHSNSLFEANVFDCRPSAPTHVEENPYARIAPLSIESPFFRESQCNLPHANIRHRPPPPTWNPPPPPPLDTEDCMAQLDKQIAELQIQSDAVRMLVEEAKRHSELREKTRLICMEHINELRKMRWYMRNNFELCL